MPLRRAMRWFSEICGICLGLGLMWCVAQIILLTERVDGIQKTLRQPVIQNNNQQVLIEDPLAKLKEQILKQHERKANVNRNADAIPDSNSN